MKKCFDYQTNTLKIENCVKLRDDVDFSTALDEEECPEIKSEFSESEGDSSESDIGCFRSRSLLFYICRHQLQVSPHFVDWYSYTSAPNMDIILMQQSSFKVRSSFALKFVLSGVERIDNKQKECV